MKDGSESQSPPSPTPTRAVQHSAVALSSLVVMLEAAPSQALLPKTALRAISPPSAPCPHPSHTSVHFGGIRQEERAFRTTARAGREAGLGGRPASKGAWACCHHPAPLLSKLPKFTSKPPSARHDGRAYFTRETQEPRRGRVVIQPASLNKSVAETGRPPRPRHHSLHCSPFLPPSRESEARQY